MDSDPQSIYSVSSKYTSLLDTSNLPTPTTSLPSPPYSPASAARRDLSELDNSTKALKATRRQSSISYVSSRVDVYSRHAPSTSTAVPDSWVRTDFGNSRRSSFQAGDDSARTSRALKRQTVGGFEDLRRASEVSAKLSAEGKRKPPLTLADKHADLLHAIAAAESRRLELQGQLATVEGELGELKHKWERIANCEPPHPTLPPSNVHTSASVVGGLKEGVRLLAASLSDLSDLTSPIPASVPATNMEERAGVPSRHAQRQSDSSTSISTGLARLSTSSVSSVWEGDTPSKGTEDTGPCLTSNGHDEVSRAQQAKVLRRRSRDVSHAFARHATSCSSTVTSMDLAATLDIIQGASNPAIGTPTVVVGMSTSGVCARDAAGLGYSGTPSKNPLRSKCSPSTALPPPSLMPGVVSFSVVGEAWGTVGRKLGSDVFSKSQKRASVLLADVSQSIVSALSPGPVATTPAPMPSTSSLYTYTSSLRSPSPSTASSCTPISDTSLSLAHSTSIRTAISRTLPHSENWLEDDDKEITTHAGSVMMPSVLKPAPTLHHIKATKSSSFDDDNWNW